ncbi:MAG: hypothetical protein FWD58_07335 [Firmicutes bacterium]|nr:hypothetical protein [Bacillota bacterium]
MMNAAFFGVPALVITPYMSVYIVAAALTALLVVLSLTVRFVQLAGDKKTSNPVFRNTTAFFVMFVFHAMWLATLIGFSLSGLDGSDAAEWVLLSFLLAAHAVLFLFTINFLLLKIEFAADAIYVRNRFGKKTAFSCKETTAHRIPVHKGEKIRLRCGSYKITHERTKKFFWEIEKRNIRVYNVDLDVRKEPE